jgi:hypothetical protein
VMFSHIQPRVQGKIIKKFYLLQGNLWIQNNIKVIKS